MNFPITFPLRTPTLVGTITTPEGLAMLGAKSDADVVEVRLDALMEKVPLDHIETALRERQVPVLLTLRVPDEGGFYTWSYGEREILIERFLPFVDSIDIELASPLETEFVLVMAQKLKKTIVLSAHSLNHPASSGQVDGWIRRFHQCSCTAPKDSLHILKIAGQIKEQKDLRRLAQILVGRDFPVAVMGLGPFAAESRVIFAQLGSRLVYGYLDTPVIPSQPSISELRKTLKTIAFVKIADYSA